MVRNMKHRVLVHWSHEIAKHLRNCILISSFRSVAGINLHETERSREKLK